MNQAAKSESPALSLAEPRYRSVGPLLFVGLKQHYASDMSGIVEQWQRFGPHIGSIPGQAGRVAYGVWYNVQPSPFAMDHLCAVEVSRLAGLPSDFVPLHISPHRYAIFPHPGHVSTIRRTVDAIFHSWLPALGYDHAPSSKTATADTLAFFERYGENFNPRTGEGDIEIWVPIKE